MAPQYYLTIQSSYQATHIALGDQGAVIDALSIDNKQASKLLITALQELLTKHNLKLDDLLCMGASQGPAPFTSLRTSLTTLNGIAFGSTVPLVPLNGLEAFVHEYVSQAQEKRASALCVLLNAFCDDVYYGFVALSEPEKIMTGVMSIDNCLAWLQEQSSGSVYVIGNGAALHREKITALLGSRSMMPENLPENVSIEILTRLTYEQYCAGIRINQLMPLYLKAHSAIMGSPKSS